MNVLLYSFIAFLLILSASLAALWLKEWLAAGKAAKAADAALEDARRRFQALREEAETKVRALLAEGEQQRAQIARLSKWTSIADADDKAREMLAEASANVADAEATASRMIAEAEAQATGMIEGAKADAAADRKAAREKAKELNDRAESHLRTANARAAQIVADANIRADAIAGKAMDAVRNAELYEQTAEAMRNIVKGYGDEYLKPAESLLDALGEELSHTEAGQRLKSARANTAGMVTARQAAKCEYVETARRVGAENFIVDAFNGKVDSILSRVKHDNAGTLEREIRDAFQVVNHGGRPFREARITEEYLQSRLEELRWAAIAQELKRQHQEEQRQIREQIREEEKARRDYERAMREAAREEDLIRKALAKAQEQIAAATDEQRAEYEAQLADLNSRLQAAEERNQRALSMAQQTRRGHVYVISNIGSFGENVYKIGLTRRLDPMDRVKELGDASVPFPFDVHAIIFSDDAPALETMLHKHFLSNQMNKVNHRKEFFRADLAAIRGEIDELGIDAKWTMAAEAREYRETLALERMIADDPIAYEQWTSRQLTAEMAMSGDVDEADDE